jgi:hypothetical protein|tara:strand:- start:311 stop:526 length:216 start_codon:yes stop_codon:yes gene_type:complete
MELLDNPDSYIHHPSFRDLKESFIRIITTKYWADICCEEGKDLQKDYDLPFAPKEMYSLKHKRKRTQSEDL